MVRVPGVLATAVIIQLSPASHVVAATYGLLEGVVSVPSLVAELRLDDIETGAWLGSAPSREPGAVAKFSFGEASVTQFYYRYDYDPVMQGLDVSRRSRQGELASAGLSQTWRIDDRGRRFTIGYEFARDGKDDLSFIRQGHSINFSGRIPLRWGMDARLEADYGFSNYPEYQGAFDQVSSRRGYAAGLVGTYGLRLRGSLHYTYADEAFDDSVLSRRYKSWGLNLRYTY